MDIEKLRTPFFVLNEKALEQQLALLERAIAQYWNHTVVGYSVKTNSLPYLASLFRKHGVWAETVSEDEYELMSLCGYEGRRMISNGPIKSREFVCRVLDAESILNIDSHDEIGHVIAYQQSHPDKCVGVGIRVNLDVREIDADNAGGRFGFSYESGELKSAVEALRQGGVRVVGLHLHTGCLPGTIEKYRWLTDRFCEMVRELSLGDIRYIDYGGGFYGFMDNRPQWDDYLKTISEGLRRHGYDPDQLMVIVEPGASVLAGVFSYYTRVTDVRNNNRASFAFCDGSRVHIDPLMHKKKSSYTYRILRHGDAGAPSELPQTLVGYTCMEGDRIMGMDAHERLQKGDWVVFDKVGSYTSTLSPLFISFFPAVYTEKADGTWACVRERWTAREFAQKAIFKD